MPWLTVCCKSRMPSASIFLRSDSRFSRSTRNLYSPEPDNDCRRQAHAVAGDGVVGLRKGLQSQVVQKYLVPGQNEIETLILQPPRVEHRAAAKTFPQDSDVAAGN